MSSSDDFSRHTHKKPTATTATATNATTKTTSQHGGAAKGRRVSRGARHHGRAACAGLQLVWSPDRSIFDLLCDRARHDAARHDPCVWPPEEGANTLTTRGSRPPPPFTGKLTESERFLSCYRCSSTYLRKAACTANMSLGQIEAGMGAAIVAAADEVRSH